MTAPGAPAGPTAPGSSGPPREPERQGQLQTIPESGIESRRGGPVAIIAPLIEQVEGVEGEPAVQRKGLADLQPEEEARWCLLHIGDQVGPRLAEVGAAWSPNASRAPLPAQGAQNEYPYTPTSAAATSGTAANAIDGINDYGYYTVWQSTAALPQSVTIDLGQSRPDVGYVGYVPRYVANSGPSTDGAITSYGILVSTNGTTFTEATSGTWAADAKMKVATFGPVAARYVRLEARAVNGGSAAAATEITIGARR
jgi:hypothetical protein